MQMGGIHIRQAVPEDIPAVCKIENTGPGLWNENHFYAELENTFSRFIVATEGGNIIGYAVAWLVADEIQINSIAVREDFRRLGIGSALMRHIIMSADIASNARILLEVSGSNSGALSFYKHFGFIGTGKRKNYYRDSDAILMELVIKNES